MSPDRLQNAYTLRWYITNKWDDSDSHAAALKLIDKIISGEDSPVPDDSDEAPDSKPTVRVALVVGHNSRAPGAWVTHGSFSESEYKFNNQVANHIIEEGIPGVEFRRFNRVFTGSYSREIDAVYRKVNEWMPDLVIELHFNGGGGDYICMLAAKSSSKSQGIAKVFADVFADRLGFTNKGVFARSASERGGRSLYAANAPTVMTEPFFGDRSSHAARVESIGHRGISAIYIEATKQALKKLKII